MDKLVKESTGFYAIPSGELASVLTRFSGKNDQEKWFTYRPTFLAEPVQLREKADAVISLYPAEITKFILSKGYARQPTEEEVEEYNAAIDKAEADNKAAADKKAAEDKAAADKKAAEDKAAADKKKADEEAANKAAEDAKKKS